MKKFIWIFVLVTLAFSLSIRAQTEDDTISIRFSTFAWKGTDTRDLHYLKNGQLEPLQISQAFYKGPFDYTGPNPIVFYKKIRSEDGTMIPTPVASAPINPAFKDVFLLFLKSPNESADSEQQLHILSIDNQLATFPQGAYRIYNLSEYEVGGIFSDQKFTIPGKGFKTIDLNGSEHVDVRIHFRYENQR
ncbi:hypothetical protein SH580_03330 [Coraliomargarita algicola]|uniref:Uncharacterized protein n=1 Tax=Coraliomargarita algicola TaxID=3092156 RepID=A0ABZ0RMV4_9BACT|nr:hypothetical protein [Coraliomargarita sp. J2-16]WPJ96736.1 hypothetical protein SH580_03330 [Coraliomargarita sp. J2-16]